MMILQVWLHDRPPPLHTHTLPTDPPTPHDICSGEGGPLADTMAWKKVQRRAQKRAPRKAVSATLDKDMPASESDDSPDSEGSNSSSRETGGESDSEWDGDHVPKRKHGQKKTLLSHAPKSTASSSHGVPTSTATVTSADATAIGHADGPTVHPDEVDTDDCAENKKKRKKKNTRKGGEGKTATGARRKAKPNDKPQTQSKRKTKRSLSRPDFLGGPDKAGVVGGTAPRKMARRTLFHIAFAYARCVWCLLTV